MRLADFEPGLDVHPVLCRSRIRRSNLGRLARAGRAAQSGRRCRIVLVWWAPDRRARRDAAPTLAAAARAWDSRRHRTRPGLHLAGLDLDQMVPRSARDGDRLGHHGLWRRCHDRCAAGRHSDQRVQVAELGRRMAGLAHLVRRLPGVHAGGRLRLSPASGGMAAARAGLRMPNGVPPRPGTFISRTPTRPCSSG